MRLQFKNRERMIEMVKVTLKDGSIMEYPQNITVLEVAQNISAGLAREALAGEINGKVVDLRTSISEDVALNILTFDSAGGKLAFWHTSTHIMAQAVARLFPNAKLAIGPAIDNGFYYDFDVNRPFTPEDLEEIEKEMKNWRLKD
jgi:threonyl-tRNA synthetase